MRLSEVYSAVAYSWKVPVGWNIVESGADSTWVRIKPHMSAPGEVIVSAAYRNGDAIDCAIVQTFVKINRRWSNNPKIDSIGCLTANQEDSIEFEISNIPSDTYVDWHFNRSWWKVIGDTSNTRVYARPLENVPLSDTTYVYELAQCEDSTYTLKHDSVITYFIPAKVEISGPQCVEENTPYTYSVERKQGEVGPIAEVYEWRIYRKSGNSYAVANQNGTTASISFPADVEKLVVTPLSPNSSCNGDTTQYAIMISPTPPASIIWEDNHCIAAGMEDSVTLSVSNAVSTQTYTWDYITQTHNWSLKRYPTDNHSQIVLYTTGQAGLDSVKVSVESEGLCQDIPHAKIGLETDTIKFQFNIKSGAWPGSYDVECTLHDAKSYEWHYNGNPIYWYTSYGGNFGEGLVRVVVTLQDDCQLSIDTIIRGEEINHSNSRQLKRYIPTTDNKLKLTPNPANTEVKIDFPLKNSNNIVMLYSSTGQILQYIPTQEDSFILTTSSYPTGTYYVVVMQEGLHMHEKLIIKH